MAGRENVLCGSCCEDFNAAPKNFNEIYVCRCGAPFFSQKVLGDHHLPTHPRCYMEIPMDFMEDHGSRFGTFVNFEEDASSTKRLKIGGNVHVGFRFEWKEFALAHSIEIGHVVVFTLTPKSRILVQVYKNGIPVMGTRDFSSPRGTSSVPSSGVDMQESMYYTQQNEEVPKEHVKLPPAAVKIESHEQTQQRAEVPKEHPKLPDVVKNEKSNDSDGQTQQRAEVPKEHAKLPPAVVKIETNEFDGKTQQRAEASKEHSKPPSSVIDLDSDDDIELCEAQDWQKAKSSQFVLKTSHANSMPDVKVKKEWVEGSNVQGTQATATIGAIANSQRSSKNDPDDREELEGGVRKNLFEQQYKKRCRVDDGGAKNLSKRQEVSQLEHKGLSSREEAGGQERRPQPPTKLELLMKERAYNIALSCCTSKGSDDVSGPSSSSASDRSWCPRRNVLKQLVDEDSANGITRAALLHKRGKCGVEDLDSGCGHARTGQKAKYGRGSSEGVGNHRRGTITRAQRRQVLDAAYSRMNLTIQNPQDIVTLIPSEDFPFSAADLSKTSLGPLLEKGETSLKLVDKNEKEWAVNCNQNGLLGLGWIKFACAHHLDEGDVCIFETINAENFSLRVHTFRVLDIIDRERQDGQGEEGMSSKKSDLVSVLEDSSESSEGLASSGSDSGDESDSEEEQGRKPSRQRKGPGLTACLKRALNKGEGSAVENGQEASCQQYGSQETNYVARKWKEEGTRRGVTYGSKRRPVTEAEKEKAKKAARELQTSHPSFLKQLHKDVCYVGLILSPPKPFYRDHLPKCKYKATLIDENGGSWLTTISKEKFFWKHFSLDHWLEEDDVLVFELTDAREGHITFLVHIFRVVDVKVTLTGKEGWATHYRIVEGTKKEFWKDLRARRQALKTALPDKNGGKKGAHNCNPPSGSSGAHEKLMEARKRRNIRKKIARTARQEARAKAKRARKEDVKEELPI